jgi:non-heme chloroperoxidase
MEDVMSENMRSYTVTLDNGLSVPCVEHGDPTGTPLLLLHGYPDSWRSFEPVLSKFSASIRAIAFTQRGHGAADKPANGYAPEDFAADAVRLLDRLGISSAVIAGHSMGSFIAQRIAIDYPERVTGLILMGSFPTVVGNAVVDGLWREGVSQLEDPVGRDLAFDFQSGTVNQPIADELIETFVSESLKVPARVWRAALQGLMNADHTRDLPRIEAPTLIVWGAHDNFFPQSDQNKLLAAIPNAELLVYETAGHSFHWEEPERFARHAAAFVETLERSRIAA